jgi:nicotinamide mononucleotide transporter
MSVNPIEIIAAAFGVANIVLLTRRSIWNYPFALLSVGLYGFVFFEAKLYSDTLLQIFFFLINLYGWAMWMRARGDDGAVVARSMTPPMRIGWIAGSLVTTLLWGYAMTFTDASLPWTDAGVAMFSIAAQILLSRRYWENWVLWIGVDIVSIANYGIKGLHITVLLYAVFLVTAVWGLISWRRSMAT